MTPVPLLNTCSRPKYDLTFQSYVAVAENDTANAEDAGDATLFQCVGSPRHDAHPTVWSTDHAQRHDPRHATYDGCEADVGALGTPLLSYVC